MEIKNCLQFGKGIKPQKNTEKQIVQELLNEPKETEKKGPKKGH